MEWVYFAREKGMNICNQNGTRRALSVKIPSLPFLSVPMGHLYLPAIDFRLCHSVLANEMLLDMTWAETRMELVLLSLLSCLCCGHEENMTWAQEDGSYAELPQVTTETCSLKQSHPHWPSGIGWEILPAVCHCGICICYVAVADWDNPQEQPGAPWLPEIWELKK